MCGIAGVLNKSFAEKERAACSVRMGERIRHRGPDGLGYFHKGPVSFAHRRLSIIDLETGSQPQTTSDGRFTLIFNGEIYNYLELRQELSQRGVKFRTNSDTEVLLYLYAEYGADCLPKLIGMFAFAVWDQRDQRLFLARDPFGIKPLYYLEHAGGFYFSSEIKSFLEVPGFQTELDRTAYEDYLYFQFSLGHETFFKGVSKLLPAHYLEISPGNPASLRRYWEPDFNVDTYHTEDYYVDKVLELLSDSVRMQLRSDVALGAHLSGGIDSSAMAMLGADLLGHKLKTFTGRFEGGARYDESAFAKKAAAAAQAEYHEITITSQDFVDNIEKIIYALDEPAAGPGALPQYMVSSLASKHVKVVLGGQGGDELFGGYTRYLAGYLEACLLAAIDETGDHRPYVVTFSSILESLPALKNYKPLLQNFWKEGLFEPLNKRYFRLSIKSENIDRLFLTEGIPENSLFERFDRLFRKEGIASYFNSMSWFDQQTLLPALLQVEDRVSMAFGLESRVPFLDPRIVNLVTTVPPAIKFKNGRLKHLLLEALKNILPVEISARKDKMGFPVPLAEWIKQEKNPARTFIMDILNSRSFRERGLYNKVSADDLMENNPSMRGLWGLVCVELWHRKFIDGKGAA